MAQPRAFGVSRLGVAARAAILRGDGRVLILRRASSSRHDPGRWELPGGKIEPEESFQEGLAREVLEETGLRVTVGAPFHAGTFSRSRVWVGCVAFLCDPRSQDVSISPEHSEFEWVDSARPAVRDYATLAGEELAALAARRS